VGTGNGARYRADAACRARRCPFYEHDPKNNQIVLLNDA
jgi:hypothetical protein